MAKRKNKPWHKINPNSLKNKADIENFIKEVFRQNIDVEKFGDWLLNKVRDKNKLKQFYDIISALYKKELQVSQTKNENKLIYEKLAAIVNQLVKEQRIPFKYLRLR